MYKDKIENYGVVRLQKVTLPYVSVIVVNYNGKHHLENCFNSLKELDYPKDKFEVILVDNASKDGSIEYTKENFSWIKILQLDKNYGFCKPNNEGAKIAKGRYVVFLNNDTAVDKNWLRELVKGSVSGNDVICCASKILYYNKRNTINAAGGKITIIGGGFYRGYGETDCDKYDEFEYTGFGCGAGVLVHKDFFLKIGGFDEEYFASGEEQELGLRIWMYGYKVLYVPTAIMYHKESGTYGTRSSFQPLKVYLIVRNRLRNILKNFEWKNVLKGILTSLFFDIYRSVKYIKSNNFASVRSVLRAYFDFARNMGKMLKKRKPIQAERKLSDKELYKLGVIATFRESVAEEKRLSKILMDPFYKI